MARNQNGAGTYFSRTINGRKRFCWRIKVNREKKELTASTKAELDEKVADFKRLLEADIFKPELMIFKNFIEYYLKFCITNLKQKTIDGYISIARLYLIPPPLGNRKMSSIKTTQIELYLIEIRKTHSSTYVNNIRRCLHTILNAAVRKGFLALNPCTFAKSPRSNKTEVPILHKEEINKILETAKRGDFIYVDHTYSESASMEYQRLSFYTALFLTIYTGLRRGECYALAWNDIDLFNKTLTVRHTLANDSSGRHLTSPKTDSSRRTIALPSFVVDAIRSRKIFQENYVEKYDGIFLNKYGLVFPSVFGSLMNISNINSRYWKKLKKVVGLPHDFHWHYLRHTHVSMLHHSGVPIAEITKRLGHKNSQVTLKIYTHVFSTDESKAIAALETFWKESNSDD